MKWWERVVWPAVAATASCVIAVLTGIFTDDADTVVAFIGLGFTLAVLTLGATPHVRRDSAPEPPEGRPLGRSRGTTR